MNLILDIAPSLEFWRRVFPANAALGRAVDFPEGELAHRWQDVARLAPTWATHPAFNACEGVLHVVVPDKAMQRQSKGHICHVRSRKEPPGSYYRSDGGVYIASPALVFLEAAHLLPLSALVALGDELCGHYTFDPSEERGFRKRAKPLASKKDLAGYLETAHGHPGAEEARKALRYVVEGSASPMETHDEMLLCLPYRMGGYNLRAAAMNAPIPLTDKAMRIAKRQTCYLDMSWPPVQLDVEHHGKLNHSKQEDIGADRARVNALKEMGYEVIELTAEQVNDPVAFDYIAQRIAKVLGKRIRKQHLGCTEARMRLRNELNRWRATSGRIR